MHVPSLLITCRWKSNICHRCHYHNYNWNRCSNPTKNCNELVNICCCCCCCFIYCCEKVSRKQEQIQPKTNRRHQKVESGWAQMLMYQHDQMVVLAPNNLVTYCGWCNERIFPQCMHHENDLGKLVGSCKHQNNKIVVCFVVQAQNS